jgi:Macrocin-O-methyltransferase (TylF)
LIYFTTVSETLKTATKALLTSLGLNISRSRGRYAQDGLLTQHSDHFRETATFRAAYNRGLLASHGVDSRIEWRVHVALWAAQTAARVQGDFVECGVNAGFVSSAIMHHLAFGSLPRRFYLIDTFAGPVLEQYSRSEIENRRVEIAKQALLSGAYVTDIKRVRRNFSEWPDAIVVQGAVPEVLNAIHFDRVAFLHLDMNCAYPEQAALRFFWDLMCPGAIVLLDDYSYYGHAAQRSAMDQFAAEVQTEILSLPTGQGLIVR